MEVHLHQKVGVVRIASGGGNVRVAISPEVGRPQCCGPTCAPCTSCKPVHFLQFQLSTGCSPCHVLRLGPGALVLVCSGLCSIISVRHVQYGTEYNSQLKVLVQPGISAVGCSADCTKHSVRNVATRTGVCGCRPRWQCTSALHCTSTALVSALSECANPAGIQHLSHG